MFAQLLARGQQSPTNNWGDLIGNLAQTFVGARGLNKQGRKFEAREREAQAAQDAQRVSGEESLARVLSGLGIDIDQSDVGTLAGNSGLMSEVLHRNRPTPEPTPAEPKTAKGPDGRLYWLTGPQAGQMALPDVQAPEPDAPDRNYLEGADGFNYYEDTGERVLPDVQAPVEPEPMVPPEAKADVGVIRSLATDWQKATQPVRDIQRQHDIMQQGMASARSGDMNAGSQAVLITFNKILDPTSVVRESEYARSASGLSVLERIKGASQRLAQGGAGVTIKELEGFERLASEFVKNAGESYLTSERERIGQVADYAGIDRQMVFGSYDPLQQEPSPTGDDFAQMSDADLERIISGG